MAPEPRDGTVITEPLLVVQRAVARLADGGEHLVRDRRGRRLAAVRRAGAHELQVVDAGGSVVLGVTRAPARVVTDAAGTVVGRIVREDVFGRTRLVLRSAGRVRGSVHADDLRGWNFTVLDGAGAEVARITRRWAGLPDSVVLTVRDHVLEVRRPVREPLRTLVVAAVLAVDGCRAHDPR